MDEHLLEIRTYSGPGYMPQVDFGAWRVAILNLVEAPEKIAQVERHNDTDEIFVLTRGRAVLFVGDGAIRPDSLQAQVMEQDVIYNVKQAIWHTVVMSADASILIVENRDTSEANSDYALLTSAERQAIVATAKQVGI